MRPVVLEADDLSIGYGSKIVAEGISFTVRQGDYLAIVGENGAGKTTLLNYILANQQGIRAAVIVNDIGEINIDAELIGRGGIVGPEDDNLIPLTNGCICCTLKEDLAVQLRNLAKTGSFDYIIIEASGVCEPMPIAHTIDRICEESTRQGLPMQLDNIIAVVDGARMFDEFEGGRALIRERIAQEDLEHLLILQIEFCNTLLLNKADLLTKRQLQELTAIVRSLQHDAVILPAVQGMVPLDQLLGTGRFQMERSISSAGWLHVIADRDEDEEHHEDHEHEEHFEHGDHHDHDGDHEHGDHDGDHEHGELHGHHGHHDYGDHDHLAEFGISSFVYDRRQPFARRKVEALTQQWPKSVIRCKGMIWYQEEPEMSYIFEQSGSQIQEKQSGPFLAAASVEQQKFVLARFPEVRKNWDPVYGDRRIRLVLIGKDMDREAIEAQLDGALAPAWQGERQEE